MPDSTAQYFAELKNYGLLGREGEVVVFRQLETAEKNLIDYLLTEPAVRDSLPILLQGISSDEEVDPAYVDAVKAAIRHGNGKDLSHFLRAIRFTDAGREWLEKQVHKYTRTGSNSWKRKIRRLLGEVDKLKKVFVTSNLRLVISVARKAAKSWMTLTFNDLIQEGNLGLIKAVERFDVDKGYRFATYASWWIRHHIKRAVQEKESLVRMPVHTTDAINKINRIDGHHYTMTGESMTEEQLAESSGVSSQKVRIAMTYRSSKGIKSLDTPIGEGNETWLDVTADSFTPNPEKVLFNARMSADLRSLLTCLTPMESSILRWRYGLDDGSDGQTLAEIAEKYNLSRERIRQIEAKALSKLRGKTQVREYVRETFQKVG